MTDTTIVITMAGRGSRFYDAGYTVPKYAIEAHSHSLFYWSMKSLQHFIGPATRCVFVCLKENDSSAFVLEQCKALCIDDAHIVEIDELTDGQATSAYVARHLWQSDAPLLVYNIDTYVRPQALKPDDIKSESDAWIPCFQVPGDHWSFAKLDDSGWVCDVAEKTRISNYASIGLYWFAKAQGYVDAYERFFADSANLVKGERYIAPMYADYLQQGLKVSISDINPSDVHVLGTPTELDQFLQTPLSVIE